jgi:hypothetical protein
MMRRLAHLSVLSLGVALLCACGKSAGDQGKSDAAASASAAATTAALVSARPDVSATPAACPCAAPRSNLPRVARRG